MEVLHLNTTTYIRCFIDMSPHNNFNEEIDVEVVFVKNNVVSRISIFRKDGEIEVLGWFKHG